MDYKGIPNLGNTCYANAALQCFIHHPDILTLLNKIEQIQIPQPKLSQLLIDLADKQKCKHRKSIMQSLLCTVSDKKSKYYEQDDSVLFLCELISKLSIQLSSLHRYNYHLQRLFQGKIRYSTNCQKCHQCTSNEQSFYLLNISVPHVPIFYSSHFDLEHLVKEHLRPSEGPCGNCSRNDAIYQKEILIKPKFLIVRLDTISFSLYPDRKVHYEVKNPEKIMDGQYQLQGCIHHIGSAKVGHYYATCRLQKRWVLFDDDRSQEVKRSQRNGIGFFYQLVEKSSI